VLGFLAAAVSWALHRPAWKARWGQPPRPEPPPAHEAEGDGAGWVSDLDDERAEEQRVEALSERELLTEIWHRLRLLEGVVVDEASALKIEHEHGDAALMRELLPRLRLEASETGKSRLDMVADTLGLIWDQLQNPTPLDPDDALAELKPPPRSAMIEHRAHTEHLARFRQEIEAAIVAVGRAMAQRADRAFAQIDDLDTKVSDLIASAQDQASARDQILLEETKRVGRAVVLVGRLLETNTPADVPPMRKAPAKKKAARKKAAATKGRRKKAALGVPLLSGTCEAYKGRRCVDKSCKVCHG
jgi:hypothetical protein